MNGSISLAIIATQHQEKKAPPKAPKPNNNNAPNIKEILELKAKFDRGEGGENYNISTLNLKRCDLKSANLNNIDLCGDIKNSRKSINLYRANLKGADLSGANIKRCRFTRANLQETNFSLALLPRQLKEKVGEDGFVKPEYLTKKGILKR